MKTSLSLWKSLSIASAAVGVSVATAGTAQAQANNSELLNQINTYSQGDIAQVNSVFQLSDVSPSDWAFDALRNLVENYNCIVGYPDGTFRGNRPLSRYEFAAGLNACLQQIERMIQSGGSEVTPEDLAALRRLINEFEAELATLGARVDDLEGRVEFLEDNQFSTTTKLKGEVVFAIGDSFGDVDALDFRLVPTDNGGENGGELTFSDVPSEINPSFLSDIPAAIASLGDFDLVANDDDDTQTTFTDRVRLTLETSFTGKDTLITRLTAGNSASFSPTAGAVVGEDGPDLGSGMGFQTFNLDTGNDVVIDWLAYYFPLRRANVYLAAFGGLHSDYTSTTFGATGLEDFTGGSGSLTQLAASSPIYTIGGGSGLGFNMPLGPVDISLGYLADEAADSTESNGLFNGEYGALAQIAFNLGDRAELGVTYVNSYHDSGAIYDFGGGSAVNGTAWANALGLFGTEANSYGVQGKFDITDRISLAAYGMYTDAKVAGSSDEFDIWSYGLGVAFNDLGKEGNVLGLFAGAPPYLAEGDLKTPLQVEGFYKYQLTDGISITPGVIWLKDAAQGVLGEEDAIIGTLRTTFTF
ncbi:iron uptake porin [Picosynechococcus sp. PCC 73109]|uniref:iron uptake porin n=1 Tax=Picosynechococcus sp. PCC 73109 TaxID=374982 RepID=UPI0007459000|nr:iron uptake porin [Picosynechococcus sp. PCC 73109]AMA10341.1 S-layer protein [Picosynechococcus sp. PCC 73109]